MPVLLDLQGLSASVQELVNVQQTASALKAQWETCGADELEAIIEQYKNALEEVLSECKRLGATFDRFAAGAECIAMRPAGYHDAAETCPRAGRAPCAAAASAATPPGDSDAAVALRRASSPAPLSPPVPLFNPFRPQAWTLTAARASRRRGRRGWRGWTGGTARWKNSIRLSGRWAGRLLLLAHLFSGCPIMMWDAHEC